MDSHRVFLSTLPPGHRERRLALAVVCVSALIFLGAAPFAKEALARVPAFIPAYQSALAVNDLLTAVLLFGQFTILRSRALSVLASAYLFTAFMAIAHLLSFPGLFSPTGLLGAGPQTTAWIYMFWHGGFPLLVIAYTSLKDTGVRARPGVAVVASIAAVFALAAALTLLTTAGHDWLPAIMEGNRYTPTMIGVVASVWGLSLLALVMLWRRRAHSVIDLWLMVVMCAWLFDIALAAVLNAGRFDLGFYAGRLYGLLAASFVLVVLLLENGKLYARLAAARDELEAHNHSLEHTVRERTERLLQSEKVATMGSLLAGVAHELNNPLAVLSGHTQLLRETTTDPTIVRRAEKIGQASDRCVRIVRNFLSLVRQRAPERTEVRIGQVMQEAVELLAYELRTNDVEVQVDVAADVPRLMGDPHQLHQVIVNLMTNAHHAMRRHPGPRRIALTVRHDPASDRVRLEVADTGPGMPPEVRARIFEPFFTTKPSGEGTGLGLSLCRGIVEEHGGTMDVVSEPGRGARFVIELPVLAGAAAAPAAPVEETVTRVPAKSVLVVDDEADVAAIITEALSRDGHTVESAREGGMALEMLAARRYDLIISDTQMPGVDGPAFFAALGERYPALQKRIIFMTGDVLSGQKREFLEGTGAPYLTKPCDLGEVRRMVARVAA